ncbi:hypothetical protein SISSUDRAFT_1067069 [Sistotremastrum suecicum HHB10207 ss-3]|uniref:Uncharacterized protein n=1 Tax=Sistotremastrum suecicum HHB10207 ss-3 TaxID=1314776 RepID=A0A165XK42_9AGAM|nr:hypothetical protein SISSUDRAFT_1067069 [Sistotremastrum suecicum HHB10207 ss-3]
MASASIHNRTSQTSPRPHPPLCPVEEERVPEGTENELEEKKPIELLMKESEEDEENVQALKAYARLVINTNDAEVLERAVPSFEIGEWWKSGGELLPVFLAVRERFLATDTSFRVKETVNQQLVYCREWSGWRNDGYWRDDLEGNAITRWCRDQCRYLVYRSDDSHRQFFPAWVFFTSLDEHNSDLRGSPWHDSYEKSVARVLSSFDQNGELGDRFDVFRSAVRECRSLLHGGRSDDVTRILSSGDRFSLLRSLLRNPYISWVDIERIVAFITRGNEVAVLGESAGFFSNLPDIKPVLLDYQSDFEYSPPRYIDPLIYFLDRGGFESLSSLRPAHDFFQLCLARSSTDQIDKTVSDRARFYLSEHHEAFTPLPGPSDQDLEDLFQAVVTYKENMPSQDLQALWIDALMECDSLIQEHKGSGIKDILSHVGHLPILNVLICNSAIRLSNFSSLLLLAMQGQEHVALRDLSPLINDLSLLDHPHAYRPIIEFLALILQNLPSDFTLPAQFDLSLVFRLFMRNDPDRDTWRKFSNTLMQYLDHDALGALSDQIYVRRFLELCVSPHGHGFFSWKPNERTSESTRQRAAELMKKLDAAQRPSGADRAAGDVNPPEPINTDIAEARRPFAIRVWHAFASRLTEPWPRRRDEKKGGQVSDIEMALRSPSGAYRSGSWPSNESLFETM